MDICRHFGEYLLIVIWLVFVADLTCALIFSNIEAQYIWVIDQV